MLVPRIVAAAVFAPAFLAVLWRGGTPLCLTCAALALLMQYEVTQMALATAPRRLKLAAWMLSLAIVAGLCCGLPQQAVVPATTGVILLFLLVALAVPGPFATRTARVSLALAITLYASALMPLLYLLRARPGDGRELAVLAVFLPWACDTGAYFAGRAFGRRKLAPKVSPAKTWEGAAGGLLLALFYCAAYRSAVGAITPAAHWYTLASLAAAFGMLGDLVESMLKRSFDAKDSSQMIPGHGGILDRFDSVLFSTWAIYSYSNLLL